MTVANIYVWWPKQVRSHNASRRGLLRRCQRRSLLHHDGHYNTRLFKLSRSRGREFPRIFHLNRFFIVSRLPNIKPSNVSGTLSGPETFDQTVNVKQCDDTFLTRNDSKPEECMRTFSQSVSTRLLSSLQVYNVPSLGQQHRLGSHRIQVHTKQYSQVPMFSLVPCPTLLNTVPTHSAPDETQRVATKHVFAVSPKSSRPSVSLHRDVFVVRSFTLLYVPTFFNENRPACTASVVQSHFTSRCRTRPGPTLLCMPRFAVLSVSTSTFRSIPASANS